MIRKKMTTNDTTTHLELLESRCGHVCYIHNHDASYTIFGNGVISGKNHARRELLKSIAVLNFDIVEYKAWCLVLNEAV